MNSSIYPVAVVGIVAIITWALRAFPFLIFGGRPLPKAVNYLGKILPPAIMTVLVFYCLRSTDFVQTPHGIPEMVSALLVVLLQIFRKNMYLSIVAGTACYMILIRVL